MTADEARQRVRRGAGLMDYTSMEWVRHVPADGRLRMRLPGYCVRGWLRHAVGLAALAAIDDAMAILTPPGVAPEVYFGLAIGPDSHANAGHAWHLLAEAWRAEIRARAGHLRVPEGGTTEEVSRA